MNNRFATFAIGESQIASKTPPSDLECSCSAFSLALSLFAARRRAQKPNSPFVLSLCNHCEALIYDHLVCYAQEGEREREQAR
jgi:hypothetical protein